MLRDESVSYYEFNPLRHANVVKGRDSNWPFQECPCKKIEGTVDEEMFDGFRGILAKPIESVID